MIRKAKSSAACLRCGHPYVVEDIEPTPAPEWVPPELWAGFCSRCRTLPPCQCAQCAPNVSDG